MHELPIIARVLELALASAPKDARISRINLRVGSLCDADPLWLERYFRIAARGTLAEGAELAVSRNGTESEKESALDSAFGYVLESIEVRDDPGRTTT